MAIAAALLLSVLALATEPLPASSPPPQSPPAPAPATRHAPIKRSVIDGVVRSRLVDIKQCYERALVQQPSLKGTIVMSFTIGGDGSVVAEETVRPRAGQTELVDADVVGCVRGIVRSLRFPLPEGGEKLTVVYPFSFGAEGAEPQPATAEATSPENAPAAGPVKPNGLEREVIVGVIRPRMGDIKRCYENALATQPNLKGSIVMYFVIGGDGTVVSEKTLRPEPGKPELVDLATVDCVRGVVRSLRFPPPVGGGTVNVTYPFVFDTSSSPAPTQTSAADDRRAYASCNVVDVLLWPWRTCIGAP